MAAFSDEDFPQNVILDNKSLNISDSLLEQRKHWISSDVLAKAETKYCSFINTSESNGLNS